MTDKFPEELRDFETRLLFIKELFTHKFDNIDIMASCVTYKLNKSYLSYSKELDKSILNLTGEDPLKILKRIK